MGFLKSWATGSWITDPIKKAVSSQKEKAQAAPVAPSAPALPSPPVPFSPVKSIPHLLSALDSFSVKTKVSYLDVDEERCLLNIPNYKEFNSSNGRSGLYNIRKFSELIDFELLDSGQKVTDGASLGGAVVGGALFGGAGGIIGSMSGNKKIKEYCTSLSIRLVFDSISNSTEYIHFINDNIDVAGARNVRRNSSAYNNIYGAAQECISVLTVILKRNQR